MENQQHQQSASQGPKRRHIHEGPRNHIISFVMSIFLTVLAFAAVSYEGLDRTFVLMLIVCMAIVQAFVQLFFWMHLKDRGHLFPIIGMFGGIVVAVTVIVMAVYWLWW